MRNQTVDWDATQKVYVKRVIKHIILACGCQDTEGEPLNECGTENCPLRHLFNLEKLNGVQLKDFGSGEQDDEKSS